MNFNITMILWIPFIILNKGYTQHWLLNPHSTWMTAFSLKLKSHLAFKSINFQFTLQEEKVICIKEYEIPSLLLSLLVTRGIWG